MTMSGAITPRFHPLPRNRAATLSVIDIGTNKIVCLIAQLEPVPSSEILRGRTHKASIIGIGHQQARGIKAGTVVDLEAAETAIRHALDMAERMARVEVRSAILNLSGGRLNAQVHAGQVGLGRAPVAENDLDAAVAAASHGAYAPNRVLLHAIALGYGLDGTPGIKDPVGMVGQSLSCEASLVSADLAATRALMLSVERCHVDIEAVVATPYASSLACLVADELDMGAVVVDMGAGTTTFAVIKNGKLAHVDGVAVGGLHVTMDIARGLSTRMSDAERLKCLHGAAISVGSDERDMVSVRQVDEGERDVEIQVPRAHLTRIIAPRIEEILELVRERLRAAGYEAEAGRKLVLTGGASQLTGLSDVARKVLSPQVRLGRPLGVKGLPESAKGPGFSAAAGLLIYPQFAAFDRLDTHSPGLFRATGTHGTFAKLTRWLKDSF